MKTTETVDALLRPMVEEMGYVLDEVEYQKEQGNWVLTLYLERQDGTSVDMDDCERVSRAVDPVLDEADPIKEAYYLSVSSIGLDRPLKKDRDFARNLDKKVTVKLYAPLEKRKNIQAYFAPLTRVALPWSFRMAGSYPFPARMRPR